MRMIVTDLTRFQKKDVVCIAGINQESGESIRPLPYVEYSKCKELKILPGAILTGDFENRNPAPPHIEDRNYKNLRFHGPCNLRKFEQILLSTESESVEAGFGVEVYYGQKYITLSDVPDKSIITISVSKQNIEIIIDQYKIGRIKIIFTDNQGKEYRFLPITDLCFYEYAEENQQDEEAIHQLNNFLSHQDKVFLRIGLTRQYKSPDEREGFWIQVNGIYTFPDTFPHIKSYYNDKR